MKIAIFHNFLDNIGGAEYVDLILARELKADIYTTNFDREKIEKLGFSTSNIFSIGRVPTNPPWRQEKAYWLFRRLNLKDKYDFYIIAGDWAMAGAIHNKPNLWYVYSPTREIWDLHIFVRKNIVSFLKRPFFDLWVIMRRIVNRHDAKYPEQIVAISQIVKNRVKKYLGREAEIIHPPAETSKYHYRKNGNFWLSVNRLINQKRVEMQLEAFAKMPEEKLVIVGSYEQSRHFKTYAARIRALKPPNVEIISWVRSDELIELYADCKGFITTAYEEDFGLTPIEAMSAGKPVIAPNEGGYRETIIDGENGILITDINYDKVVDAIKELGKKIEKNPLKFKENCQRQAKKFDTVIFISKIKSIICKTQRFQ